MSLEIEVLVYIDNLMTTTTEPSDGEHDDGN